MADPNSAAQGANGSASKGVVPAGGQGVGTPDTESAPDDSGYGYGYGYGYGGGYGGGGGSYGGKTPEDVQKETQAQIDNTAQNYNTRAGKRISSKESLYSIC